MERYNYREAIKNDVINYIKENGINLADYEDREEMESSLNDDLFLEDSVTGNASGSYTFSTWKAEENLCHNWDLLEEAFNEFGYDIVKLGEGAETADVIIRCYLLGECIAEALDELGI